MMEDELEDGDDAWDPLREWAGHAAARWTRP